LCRSGVGKIKAVSLLEAGGETGNNPRKTGDGKIQGIWYQDSLVEGRLKISKASVSKRRQQKAEIKRRNITVDGHLDPIVTNELKVGQTLGPRK